MRVQHKLSGVRDEAQNHSRRDAGYGMKIFWRDRDPLITISGIRDSFEIDSGKWELNSK